MASTLPDTAIAASNNGAAINVYFQQTDGTVVEHTWRQRNDGTWSWHTSKNTPVAAGIAKVFTPLAANLMAGNDDDDDDDAPEWHVYYLDPTNKICEVYYSDKAWNTGTLNTLNLEAAHFSKLAVFSNTLYYQSSGGQIQSVTWSSGSWSKNAQPMTNEAPLLGTSLSAFQDAVVDQSSTGAVESNDGNSASVMAVDAASPHTSLAALSDGDYRAFFYTTSASRLRQYYNRASTGENNSAEISDINPRSDIAAVRDKPSDDDDDVFHVFFQKDNGGKIHEYKFVQAHGWTDQGSI